MTRTTGNGPLPSPQSGGERARPALLALPVTDASLENIHLFDDAFLLAVPATDPRPETARVALDDIDPLHLILLEEGHCLRDQALALCASAHGNPDVSLDATSLATVMQMVANGYGITLVPKVAVDVEVRDERVKLLRFVAPEPGRKVGLVWRRTSPRKVDFLTLGQLISETLGFGSVAIAEEKLKVSKAGPEFHSA